ncbi:MAG: hypothetical protein IT285_06350 [Bdellovibrionales bacterium]|nr:hypothetical protein [Bdellovibrionales bacterium]
MKRWILIFLMMATPASAATLEDVTILDVTPKPDGVALKLHSKSGPDGSYFFVTLVKADKESFDKFALVTRKLQRGDQFKLALNIKSFSVSPSGSSYRSPDVKFTGEDI